MELKIKFDTANITQDAHSMKATVSGFEFANDDELENYIANRGGYYMCDFIGLETITEWLHDQGWKVGAR